MKSAICISGLSRTFKKTFANFKENILNPFQKLGEVDIFISVWDTNELNILNPNYKTYETPINANEIISLYRPKAIEIESFNGVSKSFLLKNFTHRIPTNSKILKDGILNSIPAQYKILKCNQLKTNQEKMNGRDYDLVLRTRLDFEIDRLRPEEFDLNKINCLYSHSCLIGDYFYVSNSQQMDKICELYKNYSQLLNIEGNDLGPERTLYLHVLNEGININVLKNYNFALVRECYTDKLKTLDLLTVK